MLIDAFLLLQHTIYKHLYKYFEGLCLPNLTNSVTKNLKPCTEKKVRVSNFLPMVLD
ncbi:hypothetical protein XBO1_1780032 [Xenorhabdus bovienii str. oregonense]|uniref:Uncharacterized protein n=1 Tax=Xenorhabdus bovienii str. oregonense TaxID=1398202 RepID=A0A077NSZ0_XENBV|nr:hypothetical protein XBO1_1780032 [Xenorhabdus bovienii str. oregonense]